MPAITTARFRIQTVDGKTYSQGDPNPFGVGDPDAVLETYTEDGDFIVLHYGLLDVSIPESQVRYVAEVNDEPEDLGDPSRRADRYPGR